MAALACPIAAASPWELVWSDEFGYTGLPDPVHWSCDEGGGGWGNDELQYYTSGRTANARVENGHLVIESRKEQWQGNAYTSARLVTKSKGDWLFGKVEVRAKLPTGKGTWPAIWMLPTDWAYGGWPLSGELDIMEHVGKEPTLVSSTVHSQYFYTNGGYPSNESTLSDCETAFHTYAMEWGADTIDFLIDGRVHLSYSRQDAGWEKWPFDKRFHLILNIAIGGAAGGAVDESIFPTRMEVDYVRVYRASGQTSCGRSGASRPGYAGGGGHALRISRGNALVVPGPEATRGGTTLDGRNAPLRQAGP